MGLACPTQMCFFFVDLLCTKKQIVLVFFFLWLRSALNTTKSKRFRGLTALCSYYWLAGKWKKCTHPIIWDGWFFPAYYAPPPPNSPYPYKDFTDLSFATSHGKPSVVGKSKTLKLCKNLVRKVYETAQYSWKSIHKEINIGERLSFN